MRGHLKNSRMILALLLTCAAAGCARSNPDLDFFRGKKVTIIVPNGPGGMDTNARAIAPYLQGQLPGSKVVVENVIGESSITGRNQVYAAVPDGQTLGFATSAGSLLAQWSGQPNVRYKTAEFSFIGRVNAEAHIMVVSPKTGFANLHDIINAGSIRMGFAGRASDDYYVALVAAGLLGYRVDARTKYLSSFDAGLACVKGEVDAILFADASVHPLIDTRTVVPVAVFSDARLPSLSDVPTLLESIPAGRQKILQAIVQVYALDRTLFAPPAMPPGRLKVLREALDKAIGDPDFRRAMSALGRPVDYLTGTETASLLRSILSFEDQIKPLVLGTMKSGVR